MSNTEKLLFFDKNGNSLNLLYNEGSEKYEGRLFFDVSSDDIFKTITLNTFESIDAFDFQLNNNSIDNLYLNKFQLFNEFGVDYTGNEFKNENVIFIEPTNTDSNFYTKWIYGDNFESKFPKGSELKFNNSVTEFGDQSKTYTVVGSKKGACMIITNTDNNTYTNSYSGITQSAFNNITIDGINSIQIKKYVDSNIDPNISEWSEPFFYDKLFDGQKLSVINSDNNDGVYTLKNQLQDNINYSYVASGIGVTSSFIIELTLLSDIPKVYEGSIVFNNIDNTITFPTTIPNLLRPGIEFKIPNSSINNSFNFYTVDYIPEFDRTPGRVYATNSQVLWMGEVYHNIQSYTQSTSTIQDSTNLSGSSPYTLSIGNEITPEDSNYWTLSNFIPVDTQKILINESLINGQIYLTSNVLYFIQDFDTSSNITLASSVEQYSDELKFFDISYKYDNNSVIADLDFSSKYAEVNFYNGSLSNNITNEIFNYERVIEVEEVLINESNKNISEINNWTIIFDDLDEFGLYVIINGIEYYQDTVFVFNGVNIDLEKTIDKTLRQWLISHLNKLVKLGIIPELIYTGYSPSSYVNTLKLTTVYPNVPLKFLVKVGSTANFKIEKKYLIIYDIVGLLNISVNNISLTTPFDTTISKTLLNWTNAHSDFLLEFGIIATSINQIIYFDINDQSSKVDLIVRLGKSFKPGELSYKIIERSLGNEGAILTSNEIVHNTSTNFEDEGFSTGQIVSVNNSYYPLNNQEYNILFLDPLKITLSYQGPFWGNTQSDVLSGFLGYGFDNGYGFDPNAPNIATPISATFASIIISTSSNLTDISYIQPTESIQVIGNDLTIIDATTSTLVETIISSTFSGSPIKLEINPVNQSLYALYTNELYVIDPVLQVISSTISFTNNAYDIDINDVNGDIYISYSDSSVINIYDKFNVFSSGVSMATFSNSMEFDPNENLMFVSEENNNQISEIDGVSKTVVGTYPTTITSELFYNPFNNKIYGFNNTSLFNVSSGMYNVVSSVSSATYSSFVYNPMNDKMYISTDDELMYEIDGLDNVTYTDIKDYGYLMFSNSDGNIYIGSQKYNRISVYSTIIDNIFMNVNISGTLSKIVYNQYRSSIIGIIPSNNEIIEMVINTSSPEVRGFSAAFDSSFYNKLFTNLPSSGIPITGGAYGTLSDSYDNIKFLLLKTREYIRRPRANFETDNDVNVEYKWHWLDDQTPEIFLYDITGDQLEKNGSYVYTGIKPLNDIRLNQLPNRDLNKLDDPKAQQTIFNEINWTLDYIDSSTNVSFVPTPLQSHIGFNSKSEGVVESNLLLSRIENISFEIVNDSTNMNIITFKTVSDNGNKWGEIILDTMSTNTFTNNNLKSGQIIQLLIRDNTNNENQYISRNNGKTFKIRNVYIRTIVVDFIDSELIDEQTTLNYPDNSITYTTTSFIVMDKIIADIKIYGQTEIEDIRYKIELNNTGRNINPEEVFIFKDYDIKEQGVDWSFLNKKRKEMTLVRPDIFNYIGSYKSIINAINYFGYNDLELYEYYRNINRKSENFNKLVKIEIPDIFDPSVPGWTDDNYTLNSFPNAEYEETNLFNLSYRVTDIDGNFVLNYSLDEVMIKLMGLKRWLSKNIIPISHNILDITGRTDVKQGNYIYHDNYDVEFIKSNNTMTPINFTIDETYILPVNSGSTVYSTVIRFNTAVETEIPDYYTIKVRTYQIHPEWDPFTRYQIGDEIRYLGKLYTSISIDNKTNNPLEFQDTPIWRGDTQYIFGQEANYNNNIYQYQVTTINSTFSSTQSTPPYNNNDWFMINKWKEINLTPVQTIDEFRNGDDLLPFNFTLDTNIDPYVIITVTSDNGYGQNYTVKKSVEIRMDADSSDLLIDINN